jgi:hypothetical protein
MRIRGLASEAYAGHLKHLRSDGGQVGWQEMGEKGPLEEATFFADFRSKSADETLLTGCLLLVLESGVGAGVTRYGRSASSIKNVSICQSKGPRVHGPRLARAGAQKLRALIQSGNRLFRDGDCFIKEE